MVSKIKTGLEIVRMHQEYCARISELENAIATLEGRSYTQSVLEEQLAKLRTELKTLEQTRFEALDPVTISRSSLGGR